MSKIKAVEPKLKGDEVFDILCDLFGKKAVDYFEKSTDEIHVWDGKSFLAMIVKPKKGNWVIQFSTAMDSFRTAQSAAMVMFYMDYTVGEPFFRLRDGTLLTGTASFIYAAQNLKEIWFNQEWGYAVPYEAHIESGEHGLLSNRGIRFLN